MANPMDDAHEAEGMVGLMLRLRSYGITDTTLLKAVEAVPHSSFLPVHLFEKAWQDRTFPISCGQTMHSPDLTVRMLAALQVRPHDIVLDMGTGSGYSAALFAKLGKKVVSFDRYRSLVFAARQRLQTLGLENVVIEQGDVRSSENHNIYDRIFCDSSFESMPRELLDSLTSGGIVITAVGAPKSEQMLVKLTKVGSRFERVDLFPVRFKPLESGKAVLL